MNTSKGEEQFRELIELRQEKVSDKDDEFQLIIGAIKRAGPRNCSLISRLTGVPIETVRYKINKQLVSKGIRFHTSIDYSKLGLVRNWVTLEFNDEYKEMATKILDDLSRIGYLIYFGRIVPQGKYASIIAIPFEAKKEYRRFLNALIGLGILKSFEIDEFADIQQHFMKHEHYDFDAEDWNIDWEELDKVETPDIKKIENESHGIMSDKTDLLILEQLQFDPTASFANIARELKIKQKTVRYHYLEHIIKRRLIKEYIIRWTSGLGSRERQAVLGMIIQIRNISSEERLFLQEIFYKLPFTWFDGLSSDQDLYLAYLATPLNQYVNVLNYLRRNIPRYSRQNFNVSIVDMSCSMGYTIPYELFDEKQGWIFSSEKTIESLIQSITAIKDSLIESEIKRE
jgi:DNA-binding Lrp family transcriptional regulator